MNMQLSEDIYMAVSLLWAPTLIFFINWSIHYRRAWLERIEEAQEEVRYQEVVQRLKFILANPRLAEAEFPNPEMRAKVLPLLESLHQMAQDAKWRQRFRKRTGLVLS